MAPLQSYQSFTSAHLGNEEDPLAPVEENAPSSRRASVSMKANLGILVLLAVALVAAIPYIPTEREVEIARAYDIPVFGSARKIRRAQNLADTSYRTSFLDPSTDFENVIKSINHKHAAKDYTEPKKGCEATVIIVRHCEKGNIREHCSYAGYERSVYLATLFGDKSERWPAPSYIFALKASGRHQKHKMNFREIETVGPLAEKSNVSIDTSYTVHHANKLAENILTFLQTGEMCGKVALVAWKHSNIGHLAHHLGCGPLQGCPLDYRGRSFDNTWQIKFSYRVSDHSAEKDLELPKKPGWKVFGSVQPEGFDPLAFSKKMGDYPPGGTHHGARWKSSAMEIPERSEVTDMTDWKSI